LKALDNKIDTRYVSGDLARDLQFIKDNLTSEDKAMIESQLRLIMSVGSGKMEATKKGNNDR
jgi:hypothetical protein